MTERPKRRNGTGTVEELPSGRWRVRIVAEGKRRTLGTRATEEAAEALLAAYNAEVQAEAILAPGAVTLRAYGAEWLDRRELEGSDLRAEVRSIESERSVWRRHVAPSPLASMALASIRVRDVEAFARWLRGRPRTQALRTRDGTVRRPAEGFISTQTQRHAFRLVRQALDDAVRAEVLVRNPARALRAPIAKARDVADDWLRADEIDVLLGCEKLSRRDRTAYACALGLALRLNDLKRLERDQVRLNDDVHGPHVRVWISKSKVWHRIPVFAWLRPWLDAHLATLPKGCRWLFPNDDGDRYASKGEDFRWREKRETGRATRPRALEVAGIDRKIRFHDLRGTCATHLALGSWGRAWTLHEIQRMLAHADQRTTERYVKRALDALALAALATEGGPTGGCPRLPTSSANSVTDPEGFEPSTFGSGGETASESSREVADPRGPSMGNDPLDLAAEVLRAGIEGSLDAELRGRLASAILERREVRLARELAAEPEHELANRRAIDLAELVLAGGRDASRAAGRDT